MIFHVIFATFILSAIFTLWRTRNRGLSSARIVSVVLLNLLVVQWGYGGVLISIPHIVVPDSIAASIGCEAGSPFQLTKGDVMVLELPRGGFGPSEERDPRLHEADRKDGRVWPTAVNPHPQP